MNITKSLLQRVLTEELIISDLKENKFSSLKKSIALNDQSFLRLLNEGLFTRVGSGITDDERKLWDRYLEEFVKIATQFNKERSVMKDGRPNTMFTPVNIDKALAILNGKSQEQVLQPEAVTCLRVAIGRVSQNAERNDANDLISSIEKGEVKGFDDSKKQPEQAPQVPQKVEKPLRPARLSDNVDMFLEMIDFGSTLSDIISQENVPREVMPTVKRFLVSRFGDYVDQGLLSERLLLSKERIKQIIKEEVSNLSEGVIQDTSDKQRKLEVGTSPELDTLSSADNTKDRIYQDEIEKNDFKNANQAQAQKPVNIQNSPKEKAVMDTQATPAESPYHKNNMKPKSKHDRALQSLKRIMEFSVKEVQESQAEIYVLGKKAINENYIPNFMELTRNKSKGSYKVDTKDPNINSLTFYIVNEEEGSNVESLYVISQDKSKLKEFIKSRAAVFFDPESKNFFTSMRGMSNNLENDNEGFFSIVLKEVKFVETDEEVYKFFSRYDKAEPQVKEVFKEELQKTDELPEVEPEPESDNFTPGDTQKDIDKGSKLTGEFYNKPTVVTPANVADPNSSDTSKLNNQVSKNTGEVRNSSTVVTPQNKNKTITDVPTLTDIPSVNTNTTTQPTPQQDQKVAKEKASPYIARIMKEAIDMIKLELDSSDLDAEMENEVEAWLKKLTERRNKEVATPASQAQPQQSLADVTSNMTPEQKVQDKQAIKDGFSFLSKNKNDIMAIIQKNVEATKHEELKAEVKKRINNNINSLEVFINGLKAMGDVTRPISEALEPKEIRDRNAKFFEDQVNEKVREVLEKSRMEIEQMAAQSFGGQVPDNIKKFLSMFLAPTNKEFIQTISVPEVQNQTAKEPEPVVPQQPVQNQPQSNPPIQDDKLDKLSQEIYKEIVSNKKPGMSINTVKHVSEYIKSNNVTLEKAESKELISKVNQLVESNPEVKVMNGSIKWKQQVAVSNNQQKTSEEMFREIIEVMLTDPKKESFTDARISVEKNLRANGLLNGITSDEFKTQMANFAKSDKYKDDFRIVGEKGSQSRVLTDRAKQKYSSKPSSSMLSGQKNAKTSKSVSAT